MNQVWLNSLKLHHKRLYPGQTTIKVEELAEALKKVEGNEKNQFASYAIKSRNEDKDNPEDIVSFDELQHRITSTYKDTKDSMYIDAYFHLIDNDGDGLINYSDLQALTHEVGYPCMSEKDFLTLADKFNHDSTQIGKAQFLEVIKQYI